MDEELLADLKQLFVATIRQEFAGLATKDDLEELRADVHSETNDLRTEMNRRFDGLQHDIAEALDTSNEVTERLLKGHERRITRLEQQRAA